MRPECAQWVEKFVGDKEMLFGNFKPRVCSISMHFCCCWCANLIGWPMSKRGVRANVPHRMQTPTYIHEHTALAWPSMKSSRVQNSCLWPKRCLQVVKFLLLLMGFSRGHKRQQTAEIRWYIAYFGISNDIGQGYSPGWLPCSQAHANYMARCFCCPIV